MFRRQMFERQKVEPKFRFGDKVKVIGGFYKGQVSVIEEWCYDGKFAVTVKDLKYPINVAKEDLELVK